MTLNMCCTLKGFLPWSSVISALKISNLNAKRWYFMVNVGLSNQVRIWSVFCECSPEKNQIRSGFSLVFSKFWSVLSLDFHAFSGIQDISKLFPYSWFAIYFWPDILLTRCTFNQVHIWPCALLTMCTFDLTTCTFDQVHPTRNFDIRMRAIQGNINQYK